MGTEITNTTVDDETILLSNGLTSVFLDTLCLAGCDIAFKPYQKDLMLWFAQRDWTLTGMGFEGFDISEIIWDTADFDAQKTFILEVIDRVFEETNWDLLGYDPNKDWLFDAMGKFKGMIQKYSADKIENGSQIQIYDFNNTVKKYEICEKHKVYKHSGGCIVCNNG